MKQYVYQISLVIRDLLGIVDYHLHEFTQVNLFISSRDPYSTQGVLQFPLTPPKGYFSFPWLHIRGTSVSLEMSCISVLEYLLKCIKTCTYCFRYIYIQWKKSIYKIKSYLNSHVARKMTCIANTNINEVLRTS